MTAKEYLSQYREARAKVDRYRERIEQITESIDSMSMRYDGMPHGRNISSSTEKKAIKLAEAKTKLSDMVISAELIRQEIADEIEKVEGHTYKDLLYARYIKTMTWVEVTDYVSRYRAERYDEKHVRGYMHAEALKKFSEAVLDKRQ